MTEGMTVSDMVVEARRLVNEALDHIDRGNTDYGIKHAEIYGELLDILELLDSLKLTLDFS